MLTAEQMKFYAPHQTPATARPVAAVPVVANADETSPGKVSSAQARDALGMRALGGQQREVLDIVLAAARNGVADLTGKEIQARYRQLTGKDIDAGTVSARLNSLLAGKLLERAPRRQCTVSKLMVGPVRPVAQQARLVG